MATDAPAPTEPRVKPTKPDEEAYKVNLAQAEKEHSAAQEKLVCITIPLFVMSTGIAVAIEIQCLQSRLSRKRCPRASLLPFRVLN